MEPTRKRGFGGGDRMTGGASGDTFVLNGDGAADFAIVVVSGVAPSGADFLL